MAIPYTELWEIVNDFIEVSMQLRWLLTFASVSCLVDKLTFLLPRHSLISTPAAVLTSSPLYDLFYVAFCSSSASHNLVFDRTESFGDLSLRVYVCNLTARRIEKKPRCADVYILCGTSTKYPWTWISIPQLCRQQVEIQKWGITCRGYTYARLLITDYLNALDVKSRQSVLFDILWLKTLTYE